MYLVAFSPGSLISICIEMIGDAGDEAVYMYLVLCQVYICTDARL